MSSRSPVAPLPVLAFATASEWEAWLAAQPPKSPGLWLKLAKQGSGVPSLSKKEAIDGALCHGWIDGQLQKFDDRQWLIRFTPRSAKSRWSDINRVRAEELIADGRMSAAGFEQVSRAKADGRWAAAYAPQGRAVVPDDLQAALDRDPAAKAFFSRLDSANRYAVLHRLGTIAKPSARAARLEKYVQMLARGESIHPLKGKRPPRPA